jgi:hypothetical protein
MDAHKNTDSTCCRVLDIRWSLSRHITVLHITARELDKCAQSISTRSALSLSPKGLLTWFSGKIYGLGSCFPTRIPPKLSPNRDLVMSLSLRDVVYVRARADNPLLQAQDKNDDKGPKQSCSFRCEQVCSTVTQRTKKRIQLLNEGQPLSQAGCGDISAFSDSFPSSPPFQFPQTVWADRSGCAFAS